MRALRSFKSVVTYTVHEPPTAASDRVDRGVELEFVKDGFSWLTALCPPLGFLANGLWLFAALYLALAGGLGWALAQWKVDAGSISLTFFMINVFLAFEISTLKRWSLERKGWQTLAVVNGRSIGECERRFFESWLPNQPILAAESAGRTASAEASRVGATSRIWPFGSGA